MALLFSGMLGVSAVILGYMLYTSNQHAFIRETEAAVDSEIENILLQQKIPDNALLAERSVQRPGYYYLLKDKAGHRLGGNILVAPLKTDLFAEGVIHFDLMPSQVGEPNNKNTIDVAGKIYTFDDGSTLLVARDIRFFLDRHHRMQLLIFLIIGLMSVVVVASFYTSVFVVGRINTIASTVHDIIETGNLSRRINIITRWDDLSNLALILNALLERLEQLLQEVRDVSDNIAHDLRTPLTRVRHQLESLAKNSDTQERASSIIQDMDQILLTFNALLRISMIEKGGRLQTQEDIILAALLDDVLELYEPLIEDKSITLQRHFDESIIMHADRNLLFQAVVNIIDNAVKFTPAGGIIVATLARDHNAIVLSIRDTGPGIAEAEKDHVFQRFYRGDASRQAPGNGLGLSLVAAVIRKHGGVIDLVDGNPGLDFRMRFT